ncbi:MAG: HAMP domain-containing sensor histidine kinase [Oscillospiraceae bacterium]
MIKFKKRAHKPDKPAKKGFALLKNRTLKTYVWIYFMIFTALILVLLWLFQYVFLESYYKSMKAQDLSRAADKIEANISSGDLNGVVRDIAFHNNIYVLITDSMVNPILDENAMGSFSFFDTDVRNNFKRGVFEMKDKLDDSGDSFITLTHENKDFKADEMFYVTRVRAADGDYRYIFLETLIEPIDSTAAIIKKQLIYITVILFELAFLITLFISKRISKPIVSVTKSAKKFADGDFKAEFKGTGYLEVQELSDVLNKARHEVSKVSDLRKDLIANISHDLRTPLTMVKAYAEMIRDLSGDNPKKRAEHVQVIIDEADRLTNLVTSILELSKLESGNLDLDLEEFSVHEKMREVMNRYRILIERDGYDIRFEPDADSVCTADPAQIDQVLYNLINNAVNYCGEDKQILIRQINAPNGVRIEVSDHGKGISKELLPLIFDRYYRDEKYKRETVGTGLGLSIVKEILKKHNFPFGVQSVEGEGSTFWFELRTK